MKFASIPLLFSALALPASAAVEKHSFLRVLNGNNMGNGGNNNDPCDDRSDLCACAECAWIDTDPLNPILRITTDKCTDKDGDIR